MNRYKCSKCGHIIKTKKNFVLRCPKCGVLNRFGLFIHRIVGSAELTEITFNWRYENGTA